MEYNPHNYQRRATAFIEKHDESALFLEMGLGKTVITLTAIKSLFNDFAMDRVLIVAPLRVARDTWPAELRKWDHLAGLTYSVVVGTRSEREAALAADADIYIINRENLPWLVQNMRGWPFDMVVLDELSSFKNHKAKRFRALKARRKNIRRIVGLTGTPAPNGLLDLWAQYRLLDQGKRLGRFITHYRDKFFVPDQRNQYQVFSWKPREGAEDEIYGLIGDMTMSMKTVDHLQLPPVTSTRVTVSMSGRERTVYEQLKHDMVVSLGGEVIDASNAATLSGKLLQLASGAIYTPDHDVVRVHDRKLDALEDLIEQANGQPLLVAYWYKHDAERIRERIPSAVDLKTSGDMSAWNEGRIPVALIHPASAGHGLNLQSGGHLLIWFSLTWSLELYEQTNARLYRQGQQMPVSIMHIVTAGTVDEAVLRALDGKHVTQDGLIEAVKTELTGDD